MRAVRAFDVSFTPDSMHHGGSIVHSVCFTCPEQKPFRFNHHHCDLIYFRVNDFFPANFIGWADFHVNSISGSRINSIFLLCFSLLFLAVVHVFSRLF